MRWKKNSDADKLKIRGGFIDSVALILILDKTVSRTNVRGGTIYREKTGRIRKLG